MSFPVSAVIFPASFRLYKLSYSGDVVNLIINKLEKVMDKEADIIERMFKRTTKTWRHNVEFYRQIDLAANDSLEVVVWTEDPIYYYLDRGTYVRHAVMDKRFKPKTKPNVIGSSVGAYPDPVFVSKNVNRPGIEPRHFTDEIFDRRINPYLKKLRKIAHDVAWKYSGIGDIR